MRAVQYSNSNIEPAALQLSGKVQVEPARRRDEEGKMEQALALAEARHGGALVAGSSTWVFPSVCVIV